MEIPVELKKHTVQQRKMGKLRKYEKVTKAWVCISYGLFPKKTRFRAVSWRCKKENDFIAFVSTWVR